MVTLTKVDDAIKFVFENSQHYLTGNGEITVPLNSLMLVVDETTEMVTFKKLDGDPFISFNIDESNFADKDALIEFYEEEMTGGAGIPTEEIQQMIDESISGISATSMSAITTVGSYDIGSVNDHKVGFWWKKADGSSGNTIVLSAKTNGDVTLLNNEIKLNSAFTSTLITDVDYVSSANTINFLNSSGDTIATIDTSDFVIDGMVEDVRIDEISGETYLVIDFNTASGKQDIQIPLTDIFDPSNYYNKSEIDGIVSGLNQSIDAKLDASAYTEVTIDSALSSGSTNPVANSAITTALNGKLNTSDATKGLTLDNAGTPKKNVQFRLQNVNWGTTYATADLGLGDNLYYQGTGIRTSGITQESAFTEFSAATETALGNKLDASAYTPTDLSEYYTSAQTESAINAATSGKVDTSAITSSVTSASTDSEIPTAKAVYDAMPTGGSASYSAGTNIDISGNVISTKNVYYGTQWNLTSNPTKTVELKLKKREQQGFTDTGWYDSLYIYLGKNLYFQGSEFNVSGVVETSAVTTTISSGSTDSEIPTAKAVFDAIPTGGSASYSAGTGIDIDSANTISTVYTKNNIDWPQLSVNYMDVSEDVYIVPYLDGQLAYINMAYVEDEDGSSYEIQCNSFDGTYTVDDDAYADYFTITYDAGLNMYLIHPLEDVTLHRVEDGGYTRILPASAVTKNVQISATSAITELYKTNYKPGNCISIDGAGRINAVYQEHKTDEIAGDCTEESWDGALVGGVRNLYGFQDISIKFLNECNEAEPDDEYISISLEDVNGEILYYFKASPDWENQTLIIDYGETTDNWSDFITWSYVDEDDEWGASEIVFRKAASYPDTIAWATHVDATRHTIINYVKEDSLADKFYWKQDRLTAGNGIEITGDKYNTTISVTGGSIDSGAVQTMIDASISGKADSSAVTQEINAAVSGKVDTSDVTSSVTSGSTDVITSGGIYEQLGGLKFVKLTQNQYDALSTKDSNTIYFIKD